MQAYFRRRLNDSVFFFMLVAALGGVALILRIDPMHASTLDPSNGRINLILQVQAWLHGRLDIGMSVHDSILLNGKVYIIYPPLPALLMVPFVAILGDRFSDIWFTWFCAALNIVLLFRTLEVMRARGITRRSALENRLIALTFGFGTVALWLCLGGAVWFTSQTVSILASMITLHSTFSRRWPLATLGVGMVVLTRTSEALIGLVPLVVYLHDLGVGRRVQGGRSWLPQRWPGLRELAVILAPFCVALLVFLVHNWLYFGHFLSTGYDIQNQQDYPQIKYGIVNWRYIWPNFVIDFLRWPTFSFTNPFDVQPTFDPLVQGIGTNMFFSTPLLAIFLFAPQGKTPQPWLRATLWGVCAVVLLSILTFCAAGWYQVGARYLLPLYPLLFLLLAQRAAPLDGRWLSLAGLGIFVNLLLACSFWYRVPGIRFIVGSAGIVVLACVVALFLLHRQKREQETAGALASTEVENANPSLSISYEELTPQSAFSHDALLPGEMQASRRV